MSDPLKDQPGFGRELGKTAKLIGWCLHDWCDRHRGASMNAIPFDKLIELVCRYWNALHETGVVSFRTPFRRAFGVHGSGRTLRRNDVRTSDDLIDTPDHPYMYAGKVMELLNSVLRGEYQLLTVVHVNDTSTYATGLTSAQLGIWEGDSHFLTRQELAAFSTLRSALADLDENEIRLLGTHTTATDNERTLQKIVNRWKDATSSAFQAQPATGPNLANIVTFMYVAVRNARELVRKAGRNKAGYATARRKFVSAVRNTPLETPAIAYQHEPDRLWTASGTDAWEGLARVLFRFSKYAYAATLRAMEIEGALLRPDQKQDVDQGERARRRLQLQLSAERLAGLPLLHVDMDSPALANVELVAMAIVSGTGMRWLSSVNDHLCKDFRTFFQPPQDPSSE